MDQMSPTNPIDCTDIQALLSGLIDDELDNDVRHLAERHLVGCAACRTLVNDAEAAHQSLVAEFAAQHDETALSVDFVGGVLSRTVYADAGATSRHQLRSWTGWLVAAAALAFAATVWMIEGNGSSSGGTDPGSSRIATNDRLDAAPATVHMAATGPMRSTIYTDQPIDQSSDESLEAPVGLPTAAAPSANDPQVVYWNESGVSAHQLASVALDAEDIQTLFATSDLLEFLTEARSDTFQDIDHARRVIEYDNLITRLESLRPNVPAPMHGPIFTAVSIFESIAHGPMSVQDIEKLQRTIRSAALSFELRTMLPVQDII